MTQWHGPMAWLDGTHHTDSDTMFNLARIPVNYPHLAPTYPLNILSLLHPIIPFLQAT